MSHLAGRVVTIDKTGSTTMLEAYMVTFLACSMADPLRCKPIQILTDQNTPLGCVRVSQQLAAAWQSDPRQEGRWFVDGSQRVRCVLPTRAKLAI
jgi:hypothetical protein